MTNKPVVSEEALHRLVNAVDGIVSSRVRLNREGLISEIHAIAERSKNPKQIVRDIQSAVSAAFAVDIDHRVVSIAQLQTDSFYCDKMCFSFKGMEIVRRDLECEVKITLSHRGETFVGHYKGINTTRSINRTIARAVLNAVVEVIGSSDMFVVEDVGSLTIADIRVVNVVVTYLDKNGERILIGTAINTGDMKEAVVKAALDAINRKIVGLIHVDGGLIKDVN